MYNSSRFASAKTLHKLIPFDKLLVVVCFLNNIIKFPILCSSKWRNDADNIPYYRISWQHYQCIKDEKTVSDCHRRYSAGDHSQVKSFSPWLFFSHHYHHNLNSSNCWKNQESEQVELENFLTWKQTLGEKQRGRGGKRERKKLQRNFSPWCGADHNDDNKNHSITLPNSLPIYITYLTLSMPFPITIFIFSGNGCNKEEGTGNLRKVLVLSIHIFSFSVAFPFTLFYLLIPARAFAVASLD